MTIRKLLYSFAAVAAVFTASCSKEGPTGPTGASGPALTGTLVGHVQLFDMFGSQVYLHLTKAQLFLSTGGSALTVDSTGYYSIASFTTGNYTINATDSGYAATQVSFNFVSGTENKDIRMSAIPDSFISTFVAYMSASSATDSLVITVLPDARQRNCIVFADTTATTANTPANYLLRYIISVPAGATTVSRSIPAQDLYNVGIASGATVHYAAYSYVIGDASAYEDLTTGRTVYNAVNDSALVAAAAAP
jgi:hypothetical protein